MFLRLQAPNLANALPSQPTLSKRKSKRRLSNASSTNTTASTIRPPSQAGCKCLDIYLDNDAISTQGGNRKRAISVSDGHTGYDSLDCVEVVAVHESSQQLLDCNAQVPMNKFMRTLHTHLDPEKLGKVIVYRQLGKKPPLQTSTNSFIRSLAGWNITVECHIIAAQPQCQFPPGDLELFRNVVNVEMLDTFVRFDKALPELLRQISLVGNYSTYSSRTAENMLAMCKNIESMTLDVEYLLRDEWISDSVHTLHIKPACKAVTGQPQDVRRFPHITDLTIEITSDHDLNAVALLRFPHLKSLKIILTQGIGISDVVDACLEQDAFPDTLTLDVPNDLPLTRCISPSFADQVMVLKILPNNSDFEKFRVDMALIVTMFPKIKYIDLSSARC